MLNENLKKNPDKERKIFTLFRFEFKLKIFYSYYGFVIAVTRFVLLPLLYPTFLHGSFSKIRL